MTKFSLSTWTAGIRRKTHITALLLTVAIFVTSCSDDDNNFTGEVSKVIGTYTVEDTAEWGEVEHYSITISQSASGGPNLEISNFGDIMYVPVNAIVQANKLTIPAQTFKGKSMTIILSGHGTMNGDTLNFDYTLEIEDDDDPLEHSCVAVKQND